MSRTEHTVSIPVKIRAQRLVGGGAALAHHQGETWLLRGALPGETVQAEEQRRRAGVVEARVTGVLDEPHPARLADPCPHAASCGGCDWPHVQPAAGAALKTAVAAGAARTHPEPAARLAAAPVTPSPPAYRLRARLHWDPGTGRLGFYAHRSWQVVAISGCRIISSRLAEAVPVLAAALQRHCPAAVDLEWLEDLDGACAVAGLRRSRSGPRRIDPAWLPPPGELHGVLDGCHLLAESGRLLQGWGAGGVVMALPLPLQVPIGAFFQVNRHLVPGLFQRVSELSSGQPLTPAPDPRPVWDLHAGVGFLAAAACHALPRPVTVVETFRPAARAAAANLPAARAAGRSAEAYLAQHRRLPQQALVLTDPPRAGLSPALRRAIAGWRPQRLLMLACDPATWARDTAFLTAHGYRLDHVELLDLFPSTHHVEVLAVLEAE